MISRILKKCQFCPIFQNTSKSGFSGFFNVAENLQFFCSCFYQNAFFYRIFFEFLKISKPVGPGFWHETPKNDIFAKTAKMTKTSFFDPSRSHRILREIPPQKTNVQNFKKRSILKKPIFDVF